jgi:hypothetical protein
MDARLFDESGGYASCLGCAATDCDCVAGPRYAWCCETSSSGSSSRDHLLPFFLCGRFLGGLLTLAAGSDFGGEGVVECLRLYDDSLNMVSEEFDEDDARTLVLSAAADGTYDEVIQQT